MSNGSNFAKYAVVSVLAGGLGIRAWQAFRPEPPGEVRGAAIADLSARAAEGKAAFEAVCAACHGANAAGTDKGPPLVHDIYHPGHHPDEAFFRAAKLGSRQHHWRFGDMLPQPQVSDDQMAAIVEYVRQLQAVNGIAARPHTM
jgi:mono/diheme cytochrome c family protein